MASNRPARSAAASSSLSTTSSLKRPRPAASAPTRNPKNPRRPFRSSPFTDFGSYMDSKTRKLRDQFSASASPAGVFSGVSIFVDGFTVPSSQELRALMLNHGGRFENYFSRQRVTHIICTHLPDSKMRNLRAFSRGLPVVKPAWVLDSLSANRLVNCAPYLVVENAGESGKQRKLSAFFARKDEGSASVDEGSSEARGDGGEVTVDEMEGEQSVVQESDSGGEVKYTELEDEQSVVQESDSSPSMTDMGSRGGDDEGLRRKSMGGLNQPHSTLTDPNFVENYFKNSRLHFIGTWRNRYRKRFSNFQSGVGSSDTRLRLSATNKAAIIHIDMDCFFVSVVVRNYPELVDKPVAVCHSDNPKGTAEISSANYVARDYGVKAGMFVRDAKARCSHLVIVPYDFKAYEEVADQFYSILHKYCNKVQALSCDEAFLDVTECSDNDPEQVALMIRKEIAETTRCTASAGIGGNLLLARLATRSAKPNGQCFIPFEKVDNYMSGLPIGALPGIGYATCEKLKSRLVETCGQLRSIPKESLQKDFGTKVSDMLWNYCRGIDTRTVEFLQKIKSVGAEVNWAVRFNDTSDCHNFLMKLCKEVSLRLQGCGVHGRTITVKVKKRKKGAMEPIKFMGCGDCDNISRSTTLSIATDNLAVLQRTTKQIFDSIHVDVKEVRGVGLHISKLENVDIAKQGHEENALKSWLTSSEKTIERCSTVNSVEQRDSKGVKTEMFWLEQQNKLASVTDVSAEMTETEVRLSNREPQPNSSGCKNQQDGKGSRLSGSYESRDSILPPLCHLDIEVIKNLPPEIFSEVNSMYHGKLHDFVRGYKGKDGRVDATSTSTSLVEENKFDSSSIREKIGCDNGIRVTDGHTDSLELQTCRMNKGKQPLHPAVPICNESMDLNRVVPTSSSDYLVNGKLPCKRSPLETLEVVGGKPYQIQLQSASCSRASDLQLNVSLDVGRTDLMPGSLSQVDISVLEQLPDDVKSDVLEQIPAHRSLDYFGDAPSASAGKLSHNIGTRSSEKSKFLLLLGNPPAWVEKFELSSCFILNLMAKLHVKYGRTGHLSSILQALFSCLPSEINRERWDEALSSLCELLTQYIYLKIDSDIEELYICFRFLKRCTSTSKFLLEVYNILLPTLQASVSENYGGELQLS